MTTRTIAGNFINPDGSNADGAFLLTAKKNTPGTDGVPRESTQTITIATGAYSDTVELGTYRVQFTPTAGTAINLGVAVIPAGASSDLLTLIATSVIPDGTDVTLDSLSVAALTVTASAIFAGATIANLGTVTTADINGGTWQGTIDGAWTAAGQTCADLGTVTTADINGGTIDTTVIGAATPAAGTFTTLTANDQLVINAGLAITGDTPAEITCNVTGVAAQTAALFNVETSAGTDKLTVSAAGQTTLADAVLTTADINGGTWQGTIDGAWTAAGQTCADLGTVSAATSITTAALVATTADINGGTWQGTIDGAWTAAGQTCANLGTVTTATSITTSALVATTADINGGTIDAATIGGATPAPGIFTTLTANDQLTVNAGVAVTGDTTDEITCNITGVAAQTAALFNVETSAGTDKLTVSAAGNIGAGVAPAPWVTTRSAFQLGGLASFYTTTAASVGQAFHISHNVYEAVLDTGKYIISSEEAADYYQQDGKHVFRVAGTGSAGVDINWTEAFFILNNGYVGAGIAPQNPFVVYKASGPWVQIANSGTGNGPTDGCQIGYPGTGTQLQLRQRENDEFTIWTNDVEVATFSASGNFGIGIAPQNPFVLYRDSGSWMQIANSGTTGGITRGFQLGVPSTGTEAQLRQRENDDLTIFTNDVEVARFDAAGNFAVGLTPTANMIGVAVEAGVITLKETTTPTADTNYGKVYPKADNKLYFQDGAGTEHEIAFV